jgi:hypothetical protein
MLPALVSLPSVAAKVSLLLTAIASPIVSPGTADESHGRTVEVARIRAHFDSVLTELPLRDTRALTSVQRTRRSQLLRTLHAYRDAGAFPHNYDFPERPTPYFVDRETGVLCAVAQLLESTGRRDIVDRVAAANNNVYVAELASDTAFAGWLKLNGLTLSEAARIQIPYMIGGPSPDVDGANNSRSVAYGVSTAVAIGGSIATSLWSTSGNADGHRTWSNFVGVAASALSLGLGASAIADQGAPTYVAPMALVAGGVNAFISTRGLLRHRAYRTAQRDASQLRKVAVSPILPRAGVSGAGLAVRMSF